MQSSPRIDELKQKFHENPRRYFAPLANEYRKAGDPEQAIAICRAHLAQQPGHMSGHVVYGQALYDAGRIDEARVVFQQALALDPENLIVLRHLGDIARRRGEDAEARSWYSRALDGDPQDAEVAAYLAELTEPLGVSEAAEPPESSPEAEATHAEEEKAEAVAPEPEPEAVAAEPEPEAIEAQPVTAADAAPEDFEVPEIEAIGDNESDLREPASADSAELDDSMFDDFSFVEDSEIVTNASPYADLSVGAETSEELPALEESPYLEEAGTIDLSAESTSAVDTELTESVDAAAHADETASADMEDEGAPAPATVEPEGEPEPPRAERASRSTPEFERTPIVTRTLAELYLQQGYIESALEIYRQLAEREPGDASIQERIKELSALGITQTNEWQEPTPSTGGVKESEDALEEMFAEEGDFDIGPMMPSEELVAEAEVSELGASSELWDTADSWTAGLFEESEESDEIFPLSAADQVEEPAVESSAEPLAETVAEPEPEPSPEPSPEPEQPQHPESEFAEAPGAKTPAAEVPEEEEEEEPEEYAAPYLDEPPRITIREFFATLGQMRPPGTELGEQSPVMADERVADAIEEEESYPYADDAFSTLFDNQPVNEEDSRAAAALSGAVAHSPSVPALDASREAGPTREATAPSEGEPAKESEEDIRRFREWLEGLANT